MIWRDRWIQVLIVTKKTSKDPNAKKYIFGNVKTKTGNAVNANIKVHIEDSLTGVAARAQITITGVNAKTLYMLGSETSQYIQLPHYSYVEVNAGYTNNHGVIYRGSVMRAEPNLDSPDFSITLTCDGLASVDITEPITLTTRGKTDAKLLIKQVAESKGFIFKDLSFDSNKDYPVSNISYDNLCFSQFLTCLQMQNRSFIVKVDTSVPKDFNGNEVSGIVYFADSNSQYIVDNKAKSKVIIIDDKWLVGTPVPTDLGVRFRTRFRPDIVGLDVVSVNSSRYKGLSSYNFCVEGITTDLDTKGDAWTKSYTCVYPGTSFVGKPDIYKGE